LRRRDNALRQLAEFAGNIAPACEGLLAAARRFARLALERTVAETHFDAHFVPVRGAERGNRGVVYDFHLARQCDPRRIVGILDWEMATLGDPLIDLGNSLAYWVQADDDRFMRALRRQPTDRPGMLTRSEVTEYYRQRSGYAAGDFTFYEVFGLFRLAVIIQQIYIRYVRGQTTDPRFALMGPMAPALALAAAQVASRLGFKG